MSRDASQERIRSTYDAIASAYDSALRDELDAKPVDRALLTALDELAGPGTVADVGCGPGHVTEYLARTRTGVVGIDVSERMVALARRHRPDLTFRTGSMLDLPAADGSWAAAVAFYSVIHLSDAERAVAFRELARVIRPCGWLLLSLHIETAGFRAGETTRLTQWFGESVDIDTYFLDPAEVGCELDAAGLPVMARTDREPLPGKEFPSRRSYLLARRR